MKDLEIKILEDVSNGTLDKNDILRRLLTLYSIKNGIENNIKKYYFYHYSYKSNNKNIITNDLIEITKETYDKITSSEFDIKSHNPISYNTDEIPSDKKLRKLKNYEK